MRLERVRTAILNAVSRRTATAAFVPEIDGLRFVAITWVVLYHVAILHDPATHIIVRIFAESGHYGVPLFFIISGFVLALPFANWRLKDGKEVSLQRYFLRRLTRLEPPYLLMLAVYLALKLAMHRSSPAELVERALASATYLHNLIYARRSAINEVAWSLEIEVQFYILAPFISAVFLVKKPRLRRALIVTPIVLGLIASAVFTSRHDYPRLWLSLPMYLHFFLIGFLLADLFLTRAWAERPATSLTADGLGVGAFVALAYVIYASYEEGAGPLLGPLLSAVLCFCAFHGRFLNRVFRNPWIYSFGGMCYTIYLFHTLVVHAVEKLMHRAPVSLGHATRATAELFACFALVAIVCPVLFVMLERPFMRPDWPARLRRRFGRS